MSELRDMAEAINAESIADLITVDREGQVMLDMMALQRAVALGQANVVLIEGRTKVVWVKA